MSKYGFGEISEGTIYPIILRLQKNELITATLRDSNSGPKRKYYRLTEKGKESLKQFKSDWLELSKAICTLMAGVSDEKRM